MSYNDPCTSSSTNSLSNLLRGAGDCRQGRISRLPSIRPTRDLTLTSPLRRSYVPNVNVRRQKPARKVENLEQEETGKYVYKEPKGKTPQRSRHTREYVQLPGGMFGEGVSSSKKKRGKRTEDVNAEKKAKKLKTTSAEKKKIKKEKNDEEKDEAYLSDNFIDDDDEKVVGNNVVYPITIPMSKKFENLQSDDALTSNTEERDEGSNVELECLNNDLSCLNLNSAGAILIEFPDDLPSPKVKTDSASGDKNSFSQKSSLSNMNEGAIGKMKIYANGKQKLVFNGMIFDIVKFPVSSRRDLIHSDTKDGETSLVNLGNIQHVWKLVPDVEQFQFDQELKK